MSDSQPTGAGAGMAIPATIVSAVVSGGLLFTGAWVGGTLGDLVAGDGWAPPPFSVKSAFRLLTRGPGSLWPSGPLAATVGMVIVLVLLVAALAVGGVWAWRRWGNRTGLATVREMEALTPKQAAE